MRQLFIVVATAACAACYHGPEDIPSPKVAPQVTRPAEVPGPSASHQASASEASPTRPPAATDACADSLYLHLLTIPVDSLSPRRYEQFRIRDAACVASRVPARRAP